jgi:lactate permease
MIKSGGVAPALLGSLIALPLFLFALSRGFLKPREAWDFPAKRRWPSSWEGTIKAGAGVSQTGPAMGGWLAWLPYLMVGLLLPIPRLLGPSEAFRKIRILEVLFQVPIKIRFALHPGLF